jgi:hypothetical protein
MGLQIINAPVSGIWVFGNDNTIGGDRSIGKGPLGQGNQIGGCRDNGIWISGMQGGGQRNVIKGNLIGTDRTGKTANSNQNGINLGQGASDNVIGGASLSTTNVISGNLISGISTSQETMNNHIIGNYIGTDISGTMEIKNGLSGIRLTPGVQRMFIGGKETGEGNVINNNSGDGIMMNGNVEDVQIIGNTIINNKGMGINMFGSGAQDQFEGEIRSVIIEGNIIGKNNWGIWLGFDVFGTIIRNNFIGIMPDESTRIANQVDGIWNSGASDTYIGPGNRIFYNAQHGVFISQSSGIRVTRISISRNTGLGICLEEEGIMLFNLQ